MCRRRLGELGDGGAADELWWGAEGPGSARHGGDGASDLAGDGGGCGNLESLASLFLALFVL